MDNIYKNSEKLKLTRIIQDQKSRDYFQISLTAGVLLIFLAFAIRPSLTSFIKTMRDVSIYKKHSSQLEIKIQQLDLAKNIYARNLGNLELLDKAIPQEPDDDKLISSLDYYAVKNLIIIENLNFSYFEETSPASINFSITVTGAYTSIEKFLADLDSLLRKVTVDSVEIKLNKENDTDNSPSMVTAVIKGSAYYSGDWITAEGKTSTAAEEIHLPEDMGTTP